MRPSRRALVCILAIAATPWVGATSASAQHSCGSVAECPPIIASDVTVGQELTMAGANALIGGVSAAAFRLVQGQGLAEAAGAFWRGAVGGSLVYAGKRIVVEPFDGAGLVGRQVASVGGSIVGNVSAGRGMVDRLVFPVGPLRIYASGGQARVRVDASTVLASAAFMAVHDARLDAGASLSSGALVFRGRAPTPGLTSAGAMMVWPDMPASEGPRLMAHERVHVLQYDQAFLTWGEPLERWAMGGVPGSGLLRHVDLGVSALGIRTGLAFALDYQARPWEREAYFLAQRAHPLIREQW